MNPLMGGAISTLIFLILFVAFYYIFKLKFDNSFLLALFLWGLILMSIILYIGFAL